MLKITDLHARTGKTAILKGINLEIQKGEIHAIMGPNGSGKSTLCNVIMGHPSYEITKGTITFEGKDIAKLSPDMRAKLGLFLSFQYPAEIPGVTLKNLLRQAKNTLQKARDPEAETMNVMQFAKFLKKKREMLGIDEEFVRRGVNEGFSGGEKKRAEILQMAVLEPKLAMLDETDSGLDIDALKIVAENAEKIARSSNMGVMLITHYQRILDYIKPDFIHIMMNGKIVKTGNFTLAQDLEKEGYDRLALTS